ncbi:uncharacterized protein LOC105103855 isoform X1 [Camelus dromedarius]|uniref:uncharacterized protein LOC105103855 isoform X1 n=1 Tax=Camelus dromedarius TaxID=9838 RepID=UPI00311A5BC1
MWNCAEGGKEAYLRSQSIQCPQGLSLSPHLTGSGTDRSLLGSQPPSMGSRLRTPPSLLGITPHSLISFLVATRTTTSVYVKHKTLTGGVLNGGRATELTEGGLRRPPGAPEFRRVKEQEAAWLSLCMKSQARIPALGQQYNDCEQILSTTSCQRVQDPRGSIQQVPLKSGAQVQTALGQRGRVTCGPALVGVSCALHPPNTAPEGFCQDTRGNSPKPQRSPSASRPSSPPVCLHPRVPPVCRPAVLKSAYYVVISCQQAVYTTAWERRGRGGNENHSRNLGWPAGNFCFPTGETIDLAADKILKPRAFRGSGTGSSSASKNRPRDWLWGAM